MRACVVRRDSALLGLEVGLFQRVFVLVQEDGGASQHLLLAGRRPPQITHLTESGEETGRDEMKTAEVTSVAQR
jgi:hypothetical protein